MASRNSVMSRRRESSIRGGENFKVAVRVRPLIEREQRNGAPCCVEVNSETNSVSITKPSSKRRSLHIGIDDFGELVRTDPNQTHNFYYDIIFGPESTQDVIFTACVKDIVESVLNGYNGSIIASGQTGSGKTHTIEGGLKDQKGIIPRAAEIIFQYIENFPNKSDRFLVRVSFLEIYNEKISDLMEPSRENLKIREDGVGGVYIENLSEHVVRNTNEILSLLHDGARLRTTGSTKMNIESSRSHAVFTIIVEHGTYDGSGGNVVTIGKLRLVDLAGSERLDMDAQSRQQEETKNINVSLHTFGKVVAALTTPGTKHIPYRDSKLTRILQDCLGGNCKTTLIATVTPVSACYTESMNTLKFAKRAKNIKNTASINKDMSQKALLSAYQLEIKKLKEQLTQRDSESGREEMEKLEKGMLEAQKEKDEVLSQLKDHQRIMTEAEKEKDELLNKVLKLEQMLLHSGDRINDSEEFKKAIEQEQERIRRETESQYESKLVELEMEKKRLESERAEVERQKEYFAKLRAEFPPDGGKDELDGMDQIERGSSPVKRKPLSADGKRPLPGLALKKPNASTSSRPPPAGGYAPMPFNPLQAQARRTASADTLGSRIRNQGWVQPDPRPSSTGQTQLDSVSAASLREYASALAHPLTGIRSQVLTSGIRIFTGSDCVRWFRQNMVGVTSIQHAQDVGQRLMDLGVFMEINGATHFVVSDKVYYQFSETAPLQHIPSRLNSAQSLQFFHPEGTMAAGGRRSSITSENDASLYSLASTSTHSGWGQLSTVSLDQSYSSFQEDTVDLLEKYQLKSFSPTDLHISALYGDRTKLKSYVKELSVDCLDMAGHTPLMYAVIGRKSKCCQQLVRLNANIHATNQYGHTPLMLATTLNFHDIVKVLLKNGADPCQTNRDGETAFHLASKLKDCKCLDSLCRYSSELIGINERNHQYLTPLHLSVIANSPDNVRLLLSAKAELGVSDNNGRTALHYAVIHNSPLCAQTIADAVPNDINLVDKENGWSALHLASSVNSADIASILMSYPSCDLDLKDKDDSTPLHLAVHSNSFKIVSCLLSKGVNTDIKDSKGKTALQLSLQLGHRECSRIINSRGD